MKTFVFASIFLVTFQASAAIDDSTVIAKDTVHSVKRATILSALLPGAGQVYNSMAMPKGKKHAYWKVPLIIGGLGTAAIPSAITCPSTGKDKNRAR